MIGNFWILVTQLGSVLVYIGIAFGLYRLLAAQKDATIEAKDATIQNLQIRIQEAQNKLPDTLVTLLHDRLQASNEELERLKHDKDKSEKEIMSLKERREITSEIVASLLSTIDVFQFLSQPANEYYKDFVVAACENIGNAVRTIMTSENLTDLVSKRGKVINAVNSPKDVLSVVKTGRKNDNLIAGQITHYGSYVLLKDNTITIDNSMLEKLTKKHEEIRADVS